MIHHLVIRRAIDETNGAKRLSLVIHHVVEQMIPEGVAELRKRLEANAAGPRRSPSIRSAIRGAIRGAVSADGAVVSGVVRAHVSCVDERRSGLRTSGRAAGGRDATFTQIGRSIGGPGGMSRRCGGIFRERIPLLS